MPLSANEAIGGKTPGGLKQKLLHGSDIPDTCQGIVCKVKTIRKAPANFGSPFIIDWEAPLPYGCASWAVNLTNTGIIAQLAGDDLEAVIGKRMYLRRIMTDNPSTGEHVPTLMVVKIEGFGQIVEQKAETKPGKPAKAPKHATGITKEEDLPF